MGDTAPQDGPPPGGLLELAMSSLLVKAIYTVVERGIVDLLADGPRTCAELADKAGLVPAKLGQVLRALTAIGLFSEDAEHRFTLTPVGQTLQTGDPSAHRELFLTFAGPTLWKALDHLPEAVATGRTGMDLAHGVPFFDYFQAHPDEGTMFNRMMLATHGAEPAAVAEAYDFSSISRLVDVGGGIGTMLVNVLGRHPDVTGVLYDFPSVVAEGKVAVTAAGLADRCDFIEGDFFQAVPTGGDAYLLSHIIHDWDEPNCLTILRNCRAAMGSGGRLLLVEWVLPDGNEPHPGKILDLGMLALVGGQERNTAEYRDLLAQAGFRLDRVVPTATPASIVEATPTATSSP
ncbi:MAG: hypothetical protein QOD57_4327 [Actinomycetota bacterium]|jgi:hypothetical protein|nr:hypothetical protein [Actinomycetota bacterium]